MTSAQELPHSETFSAAQDPFYLVKEEVQGLVNNVQNSFRKWEQLLPESIDGSQLRKEILADCGSINWQVDELDKAITVAERDPSRYGLDTAEITQRKRWTGQTRSQIGAIRKSIQEAQSNGPSTRVEMMRMPTKPSVQKTEDDDFYASESDRQALLMKEQDQDLDELCASVERLGGVGLTIHDELVSQEKIVDDLGQEMDNTANRLDFVQRKVAHVIKKAGAKGQIMMIIFLMILLLVLILLVFS